MKYQKLNSYFKLIWEQINYQKVIISWRVTENNYETDQDQEVFLVINIFTSIIRKKYRCYKNNEHRIATLGTSKQPEARHEKCI